MQWRRKRRVLYVIGSAHHALLIKQYSKLYYKAPDCTTRLQTVLQGSRLYYKAPDCTTRLQLPPDPITATDCRDGRLFVWGGATPRLHCSEECLVGFYLVSTPSRGVSGGINLASTPSRVSNTAPRSVWWALAWLALLQEVSNTALLILGVSGGINLSSTPPRGQGKLAVVNSGMNIRCCVDTRLRGRLPAWQWCLGGPWLILLGTRSNLTNRGAEQFALDQLQGLTESVFAESRSPIPNERTVAQLRLLAPCSRRDCVAGCVHHSPGERVLCNIITSFNSWKLSLHYSSKVVSHGEDGGAGSGNDEERDSPSPSNGGGSYARAAYSQRGGSRGGGKPRGGGGYQSYYKYGGGRAFQQSQDSQPLVTTERRTFNEGESLLSTLHLLSLHSPPLVSPLSTSCLSILHPGLSILHPWYLYSPPLVSPFSTPGLSTLHPGLSTLHLLSLHSPPWSRHSPPWSLHSPPLVSPLSTPGLSTLHPLSLHFPPLVSPLSTPCLSTLRPWSLHSPPLVSPLSTPCLSTLHPLSLHSPPLVSPLSTPCLATLHPLSLHSPPLVSPLSTPCLSTLHLLSLTSCLCVQVLG
uniref:Uncharacterized protein n=1 Tax=Timema shepardi TaxID=629360 RepID=A0A7R9G4E4_TIMSH|nr:unnamed protein product [Timema shepardi]